MIYEEPIELLIGDVKLELMNVFGCSLCYFLRNR